MDVTATMIKDLRERTGAGMSDCKKALTETGADMDKAIDYLRAKGLAKAAKKAGREATEGAVVSYIHGGGRIGVLVEVNCESDFVARNEEFKAFVHDLAMQIAAHAPKYVSRPEDTNGADDEYAALLSQPFIKNPSQTIQDLLTEKIAKIGENII